MTYATDPQRAGRKAVGYVRNSTEMQKGNYREEFQREEVLRLGLLHGFETVELMQDLGISGEEAENRPAYQELLRQVSRGLVGAVIVVDINRLSRDRDYVDGGIFYRACRENHTVIITPEMVFDPDVRVHQQMMMFKLMGSSMQKDMNLSALMQGMLKSAEKGQLFTGNTPFGYDRQPMPLGISASRRPKTWLVKNPTEAAEVELVYSLAESMGTAKVAKWLNEHGHHFPVKSLKKQVTIGSRTASGLPVTERPWYATDVLRILRSPLYAGVLVWAGKRRDSEYYRDLKHQVEAPSADLRIISETRWQAMQALLTSRNREVTPPRSSTSPYLFSGVIKCIVCGGPMKGARTRSSFKQRIYRCVAHAQGAECKGSTIREVIVRKAVRRDLATVVPALGIERLLETAVNDTLGRIRSEAVIADLDSELVRLGEERARALQLHLKGRLTDSEIDRELDRIVALVRQAERKKEQQLSRQRNRISAAQLKEFITPDMADAVMDLQGTRLSRVAKLVYKSFTVDAAGATHRRRGCLDRVEYAPDVTALLPDKGANRTKGGPSTRVRRSTRKVLTSTAH